jgi:4-deoxy-L-threo-5-hexosulose-uronate ketol-isomerase
MAIDIRYPTHPEQIPQLDTAALRRLHLLEDLFQPGKARLVLSHVERMLIGGVLPQADPVVIEAGPGQYTEVALDRREWGIVNIGGAGRVIVDGQTHPLKSRDGLYVGMGAVKLEFVSESAQEPARFYLVSTPAHARYETVRIPVEKAMPKRLGGAATSNDRTIYQYVNPAICKSSQLLLGLTELEPGSVWNTMPCHRHNRRSEAYFYFGLAPEHRVFHFMGEPQETRHIVVANEQAVISPPWSIHTGVGTARYSFIWAMGGENQDYGDMAAIAPADMR